MERYTKQSGIILKNYRVGEYHKGVRVLTPDSGLSDFLAYGGYKGKSKLGPLVSQITAGSFVLYKKPGIKTVKIEEFYPEFSFFNIKSNLKKYYLALLWIEIILKSHGGGEASEQTYSLLLAALKLLENAEDKNIDEISNQFLIRLLEILGYPLDIGHCNICNEKNDKSSNIYFQKKNSVIICNKCENFTSDDLIISQGIIRYLEYTEKYDFFEAVKISLSKKDTEFLKEILITKVQYVLECTLNTLAGAYEI